MAGGVDFILFILVGVSFYLPYLNITHGNLWLAEHSPFLHVLIAQKPYDKPVDAFHAGVMGMLGFQKLCNLAFHCFNLFLWIGKDGESIQLEVKLASLGVTPHFDRTPKGGYTADAFIWPPPGVMPTAFMVSLVASDLLAFWPFMTGEHSDAACLLSLAFNVGGWFDHLMIYGGSLRERLTSTLPWMPIMTLTCVVGYRTSGAYSLEVLISTAVCALVTRPLWCWAMGVQAAERGRRGYVEKND